MTLGLCSLGAFIAGKASAKRALKKEKEAAEAAAVKAAEEAKKHPKKKSYGPEVDPILEEGNRALSEMGRLYMSIKDPDVRRKINEIMRITDKITQDAIDDPKDIPQIKKFMNYYLPTTLKLLNSYDRMSSLGIEGENLDRSMKNINEMLDAAIEAYKKRLDSLFENQAITPPWVATSSPASPRKSPSTTRRLPTPSTVPSPRLSRQSSSRCRSKRKERNHERRRKELCPQPDA